MQLVRMRWELLMIPVEFASIVAAAIRTIVGRTPAAAEGEKP